MPSASVGTVTVPGGWGESNVRVRSTKKRAFPGAGGVGSREVEAGEFSVRKHSAQSPVADSIANGREHRMHEPDTDTVASQEWREFATAVK